MSKITLTGREFNAAKAWKEELKKMGVHKSLKHCYVDIVNQSSVKSAIAGLPMSRKTKNSGGDSFSFGLGLR